MFKSLGELFDLLSVTIQALSNLVNAGERQSQIILESSDADVERKRTKLHADLIAFRAEQEAKVKGFKPEPFTKAV